MKSNYKPIGNYIQRVEHRNRDLKVTRLLGLSMTKEFRETTSNIVGTDMSVYRVMSKYQFACDFMSPIRVNKLPVVLKLDDEPNLVSPAYPVFEIKDRNELDPEYLMMWFRRTEFDRYATFKCDAAIRGGYEWNELCETLIPVPAITKQREIVKEYNIIQNRIALNQQLIQKLEETAQAIYREWFVEFEFPDENGKPYKSNCGEMVWNEELQKEVPKGWEIGALGNVLDCNPETLSNKDNFEIILYLDTSNITNNKIEDLQELNLVTDEIPSRARRKVRTNDIVFSTVRPTLRHFGIIKNLPDNLIVSTGFAVFRVKDEKLFPELVYSFLTDDKTIEYLQAKAEMSVSTYPSVTSDDILNLDFVIPSNNVLETARDIFKSKDDFVNLKNKENQKLTELKELLLSKLATIEN
jgi:type I restriction enzyme, S subunit